MKRKNESRIRAGSALILVVVLTSLLAIVGVMFVMVARVDRIATSAISENKELNSAVEAVIARISQELVLDVPGVAGQPDYYDYPDGENAWLASLEPHKNGGYKWRQISDVTGYIGPAAQRNVDVDIIEDHKEIELDSNGDIESSPEQFADADGDGVADSKWIELEGINSSKGKTIFAAVRVIDNGAMLNVNTVYADPGVPDQRKGDKLTDIYIDGLVKTGTNDITKFLDNRGNFGDAQLYHDEVSRRIENPDTTTGHQYSLYDISDELELRNRYMVFNESVFTRLESKDPPSLCFGNSLRHDNLWTPVDDPCAFKSWKRHVDPDHPDNLGLDPNESDNLYSFRKLLTTYNFDRIINPYGGKMVNINRAGAGLIYSAIRVALFTADPNFKDIDEIAAQTAVNLIDFHDGASDPNVTTIDVNGITYYGFERPCVYISELAHKFTEPNIPPGLPVPASLINRSYAIELHKPYTEDDYPDVNRWQLRIEGYGTFPIKWSGTRHFHVMLFEHPGAALEPEVEFSGGMDPNLGPPSVEIRPIQPGTIVFAPGKTIALERLVGADWISVDSVTVQYGPGPPYKVWDTDEQVHSYQRDITLHKNIRRLWDDLFSKELSETLGSNNVYETGDSVYIQAHPENRPFTNVGEIGMVFRKGAYYQNDIDRPDRIGYGLNKDEEQVRIDLADPNYQRIFKYLTVFDPSKDGINNDGDGVTPSDPDGWIDDEDEPYLTPEWKIPGRININTAPWYVIAQLPWMTDKIAQAVVAYRDKLDMDPNGPNYYHVNANDSRYQETGIQGLREEAGFASIGELATVVNDSGEDEYSMRYYILGGEENDDLAGFPDLTPGSSTADGAEDDFEERDVIFARFSNLVTVRSDVFTAYILVRIGADGPQKRVMAILDRSNVYADDGRVQLVALHAVPDPR